MKRKTISTLVLAALSLGTFFPVASAEEPSRGGGLSGLLAMPPEFFLQQRAALGLSEDQMKRLQDIAEKMKEPAEKVGARMHERGKALQESLEQSSSDPEKVMPRFEEMLKAENEMKMLQFRSRLEMRAVLTPEQIAKLPSLATQKRAPGTGEVPGDVREMLQQVRAELAKRSSGSEPPREVVEMLERIEDSAKRGEVEQAKERLQSMLARLRGEPAGSPAGAPSGLSGLEERARKIADAAEHSSDPKIREQLQTAVQGLRKAAEAGDRAAVEKVLNDSEPILRAATPAAK